MSRFTYLSDIGNGLFAAHAGKYSREEAAELFNESYEYSIRENDIRPASKNDVFVKYVRYKPNEPTGAGKYKLSDINTRGCFKAWVIDTQELELFDE